ncbi:MAG: hypothetical protein P8Q99_09230 [Paracoccaceae bacterium]|nr:hypothetical protein RB2150_09209 [Rhodobacterales bacterium HTCC2150] [Rhodobacteraceae bacterium HTCC2150]MDG1531521.1 hypothetical protein [Paracoccaceae bacterium]
MKSMLIAFVAIAVIAVGSNSFLGQAGFSSQEAATGTAVRLDN